MNLSVIIPVHNGALTLECCLKGLLRSDLKPHEIIVVDDGSTDATMSIAANFGALIIKLMDGPHGPATARNRGAAFATGEVLVFLDADVVAHPVTLTKIEGYFDRQPEVAALFGSYDDDPPEKALVSLYKNLAHHYTHQLSCREASTFWAGCGAVRRDAFSAVGGFDEGYRRPSIEDIELGMRLRQAGYMVWSCPDVQATHLKRWTLFNLLRTDILLRAVPWTKLIIREGSIPDDLNLCHSQRLSAVAAWLAILSIMSSFYWGPRALSLAVAAAAVLFLCNAPMIRFFHAHGGLKLALGSAGLHWLYYLYSSLTFALVAVGHRFSRDRSRPIPATYSILPEPAWPHGRIQLGVAPTGEVP